jgi:hypothetical protein
VTLKLHDFCHPEVLPKDLLDDWHQVKILRCAQDDNKLNMRPIYFMMLRTTFLGRLRFAQAAPTNPVVSELLLRGNLGFS